MDDKFRLFCSFEKDKNLFSRTYLGTPYWQSIRMAFSSSILLERKLEPKTHSLLGRLLIGLMLCKDVMIDILKYLRLSGCDILYFDECAYRIIDAETVDPYFDYFGFDKKYKIQRCFHIYNRQNKSSLKGIGTSIPKLEDYFLTLCSKAKIGNYRDKKEDAFLERLAGELEEAFHLGFTSKELIQMVRRNVVLHKVYGRFYKKLLMKCKPKSIFVVAYYSSFLYPLYNVARKYSIPVIEIQHGLITNHDAYWYGDTSVIGKELPSYLFSYGTFWNTYINLPSIMKAVPIGNPFLENRKEKYKNCIQDEKMMVFYSSLPAKKEMEQLALDAWNYFGKRGYKILFKIHPLEYDEWKKHYPRLSNFSGIQVVKPDKDLYELLSCAKHHITYASTVFYEAVIFNNNRYIYDLGSLSDSMRPLVELKLAYKFKTMEELNSLLNVSMETVLDDTLEIWKPKAERNGLVKLREIMNER